MFFKQYGKKISSEYMKHCYRSQLLDLTFHDQEPQKAMPLLGKMRGMEGRKKR